MIRFLKYLFLLVLAGLLLTVALANRNTVTLTVLTPELESLVGQNWTIELPLYIVIYGGIVSGLLIGFIWEWLREAKHRRAVSKRTREVQALSAQVDKLQGEKLAGKDEVIQLLEQSQMKKAG